MASPAGLSRVSCGLQFVSYQAPHARHRPLNILMQRQSSIPGDPESRGLRAEAALEALKVKSQGAAKQYEEVCIKFQLSTCCHHYSEYAMLKATSAAIGLSMLLCTFNKHFSADYS